MKQIIIFVIVVIVGITLSATVPCKYLGWVAVKDLPARCLNSR